jgi:hypothetical protein
MDSESLKTLGMLAAVGCSAVIILIPSLINGYPFFFSDSGRYLLVNAVPFEHPIYYGIFARLLDLKLSPWPIIVAQAVIVATMIRIVSMRLFGIHNPFSVVFSAALLTGVSSLPWFVGWIMPDIFTSILILSLLLLGMCWDRMTIVEQVLSLALIAASVTFHYGNMAIALSGIPAFVVIAILGWRPAGRAWFRFGAIAASIVLAAVALIFSNLIGSGKAVIDPSSSTLMLARLLEDGPALEVLETKCPGAHWTLCAELKNLQQYNQTTAWQPGADGLSQYFLWGGPLWRLGGFGAVEPEAAQVVPSALALHPWHEAKTSIVNAARQFSTFSIGTELHPIKELFLQRVLVGVFGDVGLANYLASRQGQGTLNFQWINALQTGALVVSAIILLAAAVQGWRQDPQVLYVVVALVIFLAANATVTALSMVDDRYQARVIWLVPLFASLTAFRWCSLGRSKLSNANTLP